MGKKTLYVNAAIITGQMDPVFIPNGWILVDGDTIAGMGRDANLPEAERTVNLHGRLLAPGMISTHCHFYGQFARGMGLSRPVLNWQQVLSGMWWKMDKALDEEQIYYSAMMGLVEGLKCGTTTYFDHQASPNCIDGALDIIESAMTLTGGRGCLAYEVSDRDGKERAEKGIEENTRYIKKHKEGKGLFKGIFGLHASYSLSNDTLSRCADAGNALGAGFHTHLAEAQADVCDGYKLYDMHVVERMEQFGILGEKTIAAHCVHVREPQFALLKDSGTVVAHNCESNANNAVGVCPVTSLLKNGVAVTIGGDGYTYDLFQELSFALLLQRLQQQDITAMSEGERILRLGYINSHLLATRIFGRAIGTIEAGSAADFLIFDYDPPTELNENNFLSHLSALSGHVHTVVINGETVVENHRCTRVDEAEVFAKCREQSKLLWKKLE